MNITITDFMNQEHETGVKAEDVFFAFDTFLAGDELILLVMKDGSVKILDAQDYSGIKRVKPVDDIDACWYEQFLGHFEPMYIPTNK